MRKQEEYAIQERVEAGVALLDRVDPDWRSKVDYDKLDMGNMGTDVLCQIYGSYVTALKDLGIPLGENQDMDLGFDSKLVMEQNASWDTVNEEYAALTKEWKAQIRRDSQ